MKFVSVFFRSFLIQAGFNYARMSGIGLSFVMEPLLRQLPPERYSAAKTRASGFFNSHPYFAGLAAAALGRLESEGAPADEIERFKKALVGALGLFGDRLVWAGLLPAIATGSVIAVTLGAGIFGVTGFLAVYTSVHLGVRIWALWLGDVYGKDVGGQLSRSGIQGVISWIGPAAALMMGLATPIAVSWVLNGAEIGILLPVLLSAAVGVGLSKVLLGQVETFHYALFSLLIAAILAGVIL